MDSIQNLKAFLAVSRTGNFSKAARQMNVAPSVVTKRISQIEHQLGAQLFHRTTRTVKLTEMGMQYLPKVRDLVREFDQLVAGTLESPGELDGHLRIKTTTATTFLAKVFSSFQKIHPNVTLDVVLLDRSVNPIEEGFDLAIGILPTAFSGVLEVPLCPYPRIICASPDYFARNEPPEHPQDLAHHQCLTMSPDGPSWFFDSPSGQISVSIQSKYNANDSMMLLASALDGNGIAIIPEFIAQSAVDSGELIPLLDIYPVANYWLKALVSENRIDVPRVKALLEWLKQELSPPPWELDDVRGAEPSGYL